MLLADFIKTGTRQLEPLYPTAEAHNIVLILCSEVLGTKNYTHIVEPGYKIQKQKLPQLKKQMDRLCSGEPIQYVIGKTQFCGFEFNVNRSVLIPRPETEILVREAVKIAGIIQRQRSPYGSNAKPVRILDLCTGSGCIAWSVALSVPGVEVTAMDISEEAIAVASSQNFAQALKENGAKAPVFIKGDVLATPPEMEPFDLILSNPPYIMEKERCLLRPNVRDFEPDLALFVPDDNPLVYYRGVAAWSKALLATGGTGLAEINDVLGKETAGVFADNGFAEIEIVKDFYDKTRFVFYKKPQ